MSMKIQIKLQSRTMILFELEGQFMKSSNLRKDIFVQFIELTVKVFSTVACPEISSNNSIRV